MKTNFAVLGHAGAHHPGSIWFASAFLVAWVLLGILSPRLNAAVFPLKVGPTQRYLVDQQGAPFLIQGDSPWSMIIGLNNDEVTQYLDDRQAKGFNTLLVELIEHEFHGGDNPYLSPTNRYGQAPFLTPGDFTTPNDAYFTNADWVIDQAAAHGMVVFLFPCYLGYVGTSQGWWDEVLTNGTNNCYQYGQYIGNRYKDKPNIVWVMCGDRRPGDALPEVEAMIAGIQSKDTNHLFTAHGAPEDRSARLFPSEPWLTVNSAYTYYPAYSLCLAAYNDTPGLPCVMIESAYENENNSTIFSLRAQAYMSDLSGACGQFFGNSPIWYFGHGWQTYLDSAGAQSMTHVRDLFLSRPWQDLVPDDSHALVTAGYGDGTNYVATAGTTNGSTALAYLPLGAGTITMDLTKISGPEAKAWWFNPQDGSATNFGTFPTSGSRDFTAPDSNDWVLVVDDALRNFAAPGVTTPPPPPRGPTILQDLTNQTASAGALVSLEVVADGTAPLGYQWYFNGSELSGGVSNTVELTNVTAATSGSYQVIVTNQYGIAVSHVATLTVTIPNTLSIQPMGNDLLRLTLTGLPGRTYTLEYTPDLAAPWQTLGSAAVGSSGSLSFYSVAQPSVGFYRSVYP